MTLGGIGEALRERRSGTWARFDGQRAEFQNAPLEALGADVAAERSADKNSDLVAQPETRGARPAVLHAESAGPQTVEINRDDGDGVEAVRDQIHAAFEGLHAAGARDLALGEDADQAALLQLRARSADRAQRLLRRARGDWN